MFGIGFPELILVLVVVLIVFGPDKLPEAAHRLGKFTGSLRKTSDALRREFYNAVYEPTQEIRDDAKEAVKELRGVGSDLQATLRKLQSIPDDLKTCEQKELEKETLRQIEDKQGDPSAESDKPSMSEVDRDSEKPTT